MKNNQHIKDFKQGLLDDINNELNDKSKELYDLLGYRDLYPTRSIVNNIIDNGRYLNYSEINGEDQSEHTWKGTDSVLYKAKTNYLEDSFFWSDCYTKKMMQFLKSSDNLKFVCNSCGCNKNVWLFDYFYDYNAVRDWSSSTGWAIDNFKILIKEYCNSCINDSHSEFNERIKQLKDYTYHLDNAYKRTKKYTLKAVKERMEWVKQKDKYTGKYKVNIGKGSDGRFIYLMKVGDLFKVGISSDPYRRLREVRNNVNTNDICLLYICEPYNGRAIDNETLIHRSISKYRVDFKWRNGKSSREFFKCKLDSVLMAIQEQCFIKSC